MIIYYIALKHNTIEEKKKSMWLHLLALFPIYSTSMAMQADFRIIDGFKTKVEDWPFLVAIYHLK